jgi:hypothetical protein
MQRLVVLGISVLPTRVIGGLTSRDPRVVLRAMRKPALIKREVGRGRRDRMLALRPPPAAAHP